MGLEGLFALLHYEFLLPFLREIVHKPSVLQEFFHTDTITPELARRFAFENLAPRGPTFGFHGCYHLPGVLDEATLAGWLDALPDGFFRGRDARRLARALLRHRMPRLASALLARRRAAGMYDAKTRSLAWVAGVWARCTPNPQG